MSEALRKVEASRQRLRAAMAPPPQSVHEPAAKSNSAAQRLLALPIVGAVVDSVTAWWSQHPLRPMAQVANEASTAVMKPLAKRNPFTVVLVAGALGAGLAWTRPWRWMFRSALFAGLVPQLASRVVSSLPIESWMSMVGAAMARQQGPARRAPEAPTA
ncbi:MAG: hypothetical protein H7Y61_07280 [Rhizobiales bacterium]|nr:hypothetical protein [Rhizobacter sp.]